MKTLLFYFALLSFATAANVTLAWDATPLATCYRLHWGTESGHYTQSQDTVATSTTVALAPGVYYFTVNGMNQFGETPLSEELVYFARDILPSFVSEIGNGSVRVSPTTGNVPAPNGLKLQRSDDLKTWTDMASFPVPTADIVIQDSANVPRRFYRIVLP